MKSLKVFQQKIKSYIYIFDNEDVKISKQALIDYGFERDNHWRELLIAVFLVGVWSLISWFIVVAFNLETVSWSQAFSAALSFGISIVVYRQWRLTRYEISIDKYYDRLDSVNKRLEVLKEKDKIDNQKHRYTLYVFAELDKLEYVSAKYQLGFMTPVLAHRAVLNFEKLCQYKDDGKFSSEACKWVDRAAYTTKVQKVVRRIYTQAENNRHIKVTDE